MDIPALALLVIAMHREAADIFYARETLDHHAHYDQSTFSAHNPGLGIAQPPDAWHEMPGCRVLKNLFLDPAALKRSEWLFGMYCFFC